MILINVCLIHFLTIYLFSQIRRLSVILRYNLTLGLRFSFLNFFKQIFSSIYCSFSVNIVSYDESDNYLKGTTEIGKNVFCRL